jgi:hypothetical protein
MSFDSLYHAGFEYIKTLTKVGLHGIEFGIEVIESQLASAATMTVIMENRRKMLEVLLLLLLLQQRGSV